ncbi:MULTISPECIES: peptidoglycan DD-metalloendopeptidase family protein [Enterococcus]|uniref:peptidoglycan DD-metalloendopeptidase family protein n=1 Tax=Enterococcus TaxID=1350 RepID=UPI000A35B1C0|nr:MULTISPECIES: peptidoglycan DD-metalloendopeptidase family protein [Enterococcus]MBE9900432.1 peptidoglycan DD-metalloendopeptidase family protein [Enterococcus casseliflavus]MBE9903719.1 peptidoglycan DD-metalloendopeptidase family protein [Enterococcus casseliflavus]MBE9924126.1 peptidoglycan DD-metalloendopeptidase family protein [Enterococcus casseliflavus]MCB7450203.1 peptidoglycan DD-metalloendopeptidase family protein [Enterococcus gallinarum]MCD5156393.1 peptidoglycan DD-metalloendo
MKKIIISTSVIVFSLFFSNSILVKAQTIEEKIKEKNDKIETIVKDQKSAKIYLTDLDNKITQLENEYQKVLKEKNTSEKKLTEINQKITTLEEKIHLRNKLIEEQARNAQVNQKSDSIISVMVNAESLSDAVTAAFGMTKLISASNEIMQAQIDDKESLDELKKEAEKKVIDAEKETRSLEEKEKNLIEAKLNQSIKINEISASLATEQSEKEKFENQKQEAEKRREEELKALAEEKKKEAEAAAILKAQEEESASIIKDQKNEVSQIDGNEDIGTDQGNTDTQEEKQITNETSDKESNSVNQDEYQDNNNSSNNNQVQSPSSSGWGAPVANIIVTSPFGGRADPTGFSGSFHDGIDMGGTSSTPIMASRSGTVVQASFDGSAGNYIIIDHGDGYYSYYLHLSNFIATLGQSVSAGQTIGTMGTTGNSTGVHLHFGIATSSNWSGFVDPAPFLGI